MTHALHPDLGLHGLADGCGECRRIADDPVEWLDEANLASLWLRVVMFELRHDEESRPRSETEARAMRALRPTVRLLRAAGASVVQLEALLAPGSRLAVERRHT